MVISVKTASQNFIKVADVAPKEKFVARVQPAHCAYTAVRESVSSVTLLREDIVSIASMLDMELRITQDCNHFLTISATC